MSKIKDSLRWLFYKGLYKPGHFYSTIPSVKEVEAKADRIFTNTEPLAVNIKKDAQLTLVKELSVFKEDFAWPAKNN